MRCDVPGCEEAFRTYSVASVAREQSQLHGGMRRLKLKALPGWQDFGLGESPRKLVDICATHVPKARMDGAP